MPVIIGGAVGGGVILLGCIGVCAYCLLNKKGATVAAETPKSQPAAIGQPVPQQTPFTQATPVYEFRNPSHESTPSAPGPNSAYKPKFCGHCGSPLGNNAAKFCPHCGGKLQEDSGEKDPRRQTTFPPARGLARRETHTFPEIREQITLPSKS